MTGWKLMGADLVHRQHHNRSPSFRGHLGRPVLSGEEVESERPTSGPQHTGALASGGVSPAVHAPHAPGSIDRTSPCDVRPISPRGPTLSMSPGKAASIKAARVPHSSELVLSQRPGPWHAPPDPPLAAWARRRQSGGGEAGAGVPAKIGSCRCQMS